MAAEEVWVPHEMLQAEDRVHRIGSEIWDTVWAHHLAVEGSLDDGRFLVRYRRADRTVGVLGWKMAKQARLLRQEIG